MEPRTSEPPGSAPGAPAQAAGARCWVCDSTDTREWRVGAVAERLEPEDLRITDSRYGLTLSLSRCAACGFRFADSAEVERLESLYRELTDPGYEGSRESRRLQMRELVALARELCPGARSALDVGAASGLLVAEAGRAGLAAVGVEPSRSLVEVAQREHGVEMLEGVLPHPGLEGRSFDLVFLVDVLEHVADPVGLLRLCAAHVAPGGVLLIVTPDFSSPTTRLFGSRCWHYRLAHVGCFDRRSLETALARAGLCALRWKRELRFLPVSYLATRAESYLPVAWLNRLARRVAPLAWLWGRVIRLQLRDSWVVVAGADPGAPLQQRRSRGPRGAVSPGTGWDVRAGPDPGCTVPGAPASCAR